MLISVQLTTVKCTVYEFCVRAINVAGKSELSDSSMGETPVPGMLCVWSAVYYTVSLLCFRNSFLLLLARHTYRISSQGGKRVAADHPVRAASMARRCVGGRTSARIKGRVSEKRGRGKKASARPGEIFFEKNKEKEQNLPAQLWPRSSSTTYWYCPSPTALFSNLA